MVRGCRPRRGSPLVVRGRVVGEVEVDVVGHGGLVDRVRCSVGPALGVGPSSVGGLVVGAAAGEVGVLVGLVVDDGGSSSVTSTGSRVPVGLLRGVGLLVGAGLARPGHPGLGEDDLHPVGHPGDHPLAHPEGGGHRVDGQLGPVDEGPDGALLGPEAGEGAGIGGGAQSARSRVVLRSSAGRGHLAPLPPTDLVPAGDPHVVEQEDHRVVGPLPPGAVGPHVGRLEGGVTSLPPSTRCASRRQVGSTRSISAAQARLLPWRAAVSMRSAVGSVASSPAGPVASPGSERGASRAGGGGAGLVGDTDVGELGVVRGGDLVRTGDGSPVGPMAHRRLSRQDSLAPCHVAPGSQRSSSSRWR